MVAMCASLARRAVTPASLGCTWCAVFVNTAEGHPPTQQLSRLDCVKQLFHAFANRSMAYQYAHVIGLTLFGSDVVMSCEATELFVHFQVWCVNG